MRTLGGLREFINHLESLGELKRVSAPVDPKCEIAAVLEQLEKKGGPAVLFEEVKGYAMPLAANLLGTRKRLALALGMEEQDPINGLLPKMDKQITPYLLKEENERVVFSPNDANPIGELIPVLTHYVDDSGPFITSGLTSARDPKTGVTGRGLHRLEIRGPAEIGISLVNPPLSEIYAVHKAQGTKMEVVITVGVDPAILVGTVLKVPKGVDKLAFVGGLMGAAVPTAKSATMDMEIPAYSEIILEGTIDPAEPEKGGVLGEVSGYYMSFPSPTIHVSSISMRRDPIYHGLLPRGNEVDHLLVFVYGLNVIPKMKKEFSFLRDVHFVPGTFGANAVMSLDTEDKGEIRRAITMALTFPNIKKAVAVNTDVTIDDPLDVEWALATRFQADKDLIVVPGLKGQPIDPSAGEGFLTAKTGFDATWPVAEGYKKIGYPKELENRLPTLIKEIRKGS